MKSPMFSREGCYWVAFIQNREKGRWVEAANLKTAKFLFAQQENVVMSGYIVASKKGYE